jgi:hypothetical protein
MATSSSTSDLGTSVVRTIVPIVVGLVVALAAKAGLHLTSASVTPIIASGVGAAYYAAVRLLEQKWPALGVLLGSATQPVYVPATPAKAPAAK